MFNNGIRLIFATESAIMKITILAVLLIVLSVIVLSRYLFSSVRPFARLMAAVPADHGLCAIDQCVKECGHIWFFYSLLRNDEQMRLTVSLNVPCPEQEEDLQGLDSDIKALVTDLRQTTALAREEWCQMEGPLAKRLYLEFDWAEISAAMIQSFQERVMDILRNRHADAVVKHFRGSGDFDIYYSEQVGNIIERSLDMVDAFDIRKYSFKSEGMLGYNEKNEIPATAEEFEELFDFVSEMEFDRLGCFAYSKEEGTKAASMKPQVRSDVKERRKDRIMELQRQISLKHNTELIGRTIEVLVEGEEEPGLYRGRTYMDAPDIDNEVLFKSPKSLESGTFASVAINDAFDYDLTGELVNE